MSHRTRRRLFWAAGVGVAALAGLLVVLLLPNEKGGIATPTASGPVQRVPRPQQVAVTPRTREQIDATFDRFVPLAMGRRDPVAARAYVTPNLRSQAPLEDWRSGTIPVPPFEAEGPPFHGWTPVYSYPKDVLVELTLQPKLPTDPVTSFSVDLKRIGGKWLVDGIYELGTHGGVAAPPKRTGPPPPRGGASDVDNGLKGRLSFVWILVPLLLLSLIVIAPAAVFTRDWLAHRRVARKWKGEPKELPPLPKPRPREPAERP